MGLTHLMRRWHAKARAVVNRVTRSPRWRHVESAHLKLHPTCSGCGSVMHLQVHHVKPFHLDPELELDPTNLVTACMDEPECHLRVAHGDNFRAYNPNVLQHFAMMVHDPGARESMWLKAKADRLMALK